MKQKRVAAIHDISGFGKCSLTVALPILSAAGIECSCVPTAVLSTHTGGLSGYTYRDLTDDLPGFYRHWQALGLEFDALYSGYLGSEAQLAIIADLFAALKGKDTLVLVDPVMGDNGALYTHFTPSFVRGMRHLVSQADLVIPNITEATHMLDMPYTSGPYTEEYIRGVLRSLTALGPKQAVLTGIALDDTRVGVATYTRATDALHFALMPCVPGHYHGTGDVFGSALLGALMHDNALEAAAHIAVEFTVQSIQRTHAAGTDLRFGVNFEQSLPGYMRALGCV
ncbi:pyridoxal kinase [Bacteroidia bacterium]|nr:pyridoxal kinase [Bacteroidia bacterium]